MNRIRVRPDIMELVPPAAEEVDELVIPTEWRMKSAARRHEQREGLRRYGVRAAWRWIKCSLGFRRGAVKHHHHPVRVAASNSCTCTPTPTTKL